MGQETTRPDLYAGASAAEGLQRSTKGSATANLRGEKGRGGGDKAERVKEALSSLSFSFSLPEITAS